MNRLSYLHAPLGAIHGEANSLKVPSAHFIVAHGNCMFSFLVVDANPTVILERGEGSKSEMRVTVLFLPA